MHDTPQAAASPPTRPAPAEAAWRQASEQPLAFDCDGDTLIGVLHRPAAAHAIGVVILVGGPQYRVGPHRLYRHLAERLAAAGHAVLRFDYRGIGDSEGDYPGFERVGPDIAAAMDALIRHCPEVRRVVLWGLCEGASSILLQAADEPRLAGAVLVNPWVRSEATAAQTRLRHYYLARLMRRAFWARLARGALDLGAALRGVAATVRAARSAGRGAGMAASLPERMAAGLARVRGPVLLVLSGRDLTAREFADVASASPRWRALLAAPRIERLDMPDCDHTFSGAARRDALAARLCDWLDRLRRAG